MSDHVISKSFHPAQSHKTPVIRFREPAGFAAALTCCGDWISEGSTKMTTSPSPSTAASASQNHASRFLSTRADGTWLPGGVSAGITVAGGCGFADIGSERPMGPQNRFQKRRCALTVPATWHIAPLLNRSVHGFPRPVPPPGGGFSGEGFIHLNDCSGAASSLRALRHSLYGSSMLRQKLSK